MKTQLQAVLAVWAAVCVLMAGPAGAQGTSGLLSGRVSDPSGAAVPGVTVTAISPLTGESRVSVTAVERVYMLPGVPVGTWTLTYHLDGCTRVTRTGILVETAVPRADNVTLALGGITEMVTVDGASPILNVTTPTVT